MSRRPWKTYPFTRHDDVRAIESAWLSSFGAFGYGKLVEVSGGWVETNLSDRDFRRLCRHADVEHVPDYVSDSAPSWERPIEPEDDAEFEARMDAARARRHPTPTS